MSTTLEMIVVCFLIHGDSERLERNIIVDYIYMSKTIIIECTHTKAATLVDNYRRRPQQLRTESITDQQQ